MRGLHVIAATAILSIASMAAASAQVANCDPYGPQLKPIAALLNQGKFPDAQIQADAALKQHPDDFHTAYYSHRAKISLIDAQDQKKGSYIPPSPEFTSEIAKLKVLAKQLDKMNQQCVTRSNFGAVYDFIGNEYLYRNQLPQAECWLLRADRAVYETTPDGRRTQLGISEGLGLTYMLQRKYPLARYYYGQAKSEGSKTAGTVLSTNQFVKRAAPPPTLPTAAVREQMVCKAAEKPS